MALLNILIFPDPRLKEIAKPVTKIDENIKNIVNDMLETMHHTNGIGLAATQVNIHQRIIVIDIPDSNREPFCIINPVVVEHSGTLVWEEGCLSLPDIRAKVKRHANITIEYQDIENKTQSLSAAGLLSVCIQHELDHINGITFYDRLSPLKRALLKNKIKSLGKS